jgi:hypothetical protein
MRRVGLVAPLLLTGVLASAVVAATVATAEPPPPCSYVLSPPQLTEANTVTVTVAPAECGFPAAPGFAVACVQRQGDSVTCSQGRGETPAAVSLPVSPGATYVATGRGCGSWAGISDTTPNCQYLGPISATP